MTPAFRIAVLSPTTLNAARKTNRLDAAPLRIEGADELTARYVVTPGRYLISVRAHVHAPAGSLAYEQILWTREAGAVPYVSTARSTYARSSERRSAYLSAIDIRTKPLRWRGPALVANARHFVVAGDVLVTGDGFAAEPDDLYALDRATWRVVGRPTLASTPERIVRRGNNVTVDPYDHGLTVRLVR
jgi:hypothetical protein